MNSKDNEFDRRMREKLYGFAPDAPADLWHKIEARLAAEAKGNDTVTAPLKPRRKPTGWWMAAAAIPAVIALAFWFGRPVEVTYLQGKATKPDDVPTMHSAPQSEETATADARPDTAPANAFAPEPAPKPDEPTVQVPDRRTGPASVIERPAADRPLPAPSREVAAVTPTADTLKTRLVDMREVQPPVVLDDTDAEGMMLAAASTPEHTFGAGQLLNWVVGAVDQRAEKAVTFSSDREGSLKIDFNFNLARNRKKR